MVIAIIAILAAIMFFPIPIVKGKMNRPNCLSNMRQLDLGWSIYATTDGGRTGEELYLRRRRGPLGLWMQMETSGLRSAGSDERE